MKIKKEDRPDIVTDYNSGKTVAQLARKHRVSEQTIRLILKREGIVFTRKRGNNYKIPPSKYPQVIKMYERQKVKNLDNIAWRFGVQPQTIRKILKKEGYYIRINRSPGRVPKTKYKEVIRMYKNGESTRRIGRRFEVSHQQVCNILEECNVSRRTAREWRRKRVDA